MMLCELRLQVARYNNLISNNFSPPCILESVLQDEFGLPYVRCKKCFYNLEGLPVCSRESIGDII